MNSIRTRLMLGSAIGIALVLAACGLGVHFMIGRTLWSQFDDALAARAQALTALVDVTLAVDEHAPCVDSSCTVPGCCGTGAGE